MDTCGYRGVAQVKDFDWILFFTGSAKLNHPTLSADLMLTSSVDGLVYGNC